MYREDRLEDARLKAVNRFQQIDYNRSKEFQDIVNLAAELCDKPVALISLVDKDTSWIKVKTGVDIEALPKETSFCKHTIRQDNLIIVPDATEDERFSHNPLVCNKPSVRFYAGAPLIIKNGLKLGALCLFDDKPNNITALQAKTLTILSRQVTFLMELELSHKLLLQRMKEVEAQNTALRKIAYIQSHDIRRPLSSIMGLVNTMKDDDYAVDRDWVMMIEEAAYDLDNKIRTIVDLTYVNSKLLH